MTQSRSLGQAWFTWRRTAWPTENYRQGQRKAVTYWLECSLDHVASYMEALQNGSPRGRVGSELVSRLLVDLDLAELELRNCGVSESSKDRYWVFIAATRRVLTELERDS